ncbi:hypothetical protein L3X38_003764 [Prunus dulcis]|uniref:Uncharacterized protein n=1 Tax=Prunus dulcis TaxID=3755 RepID=A0AAD4ZMN3_PRUDU|nr:hypothetical protein L3X38_003764 [Prunus dulcis]
MVIGASSSPFMSHPVKFRYLDKRVVEDRFLVAGSGGRWLLGFRGVIWISCYIGSLFSILLFSALGMA